MPEFDTYLTHNLVCPYCGYEHEDPDDMRASGTYPCQRCEKEFTYSCDYTVYYITEKAKEDG